MRLPFSIFLASAALLFAGCGTITYERARFDGNRVSNPTLGRGVYYQIPETYSVLNPRSPVPTSPENVKFETYLRQISAANDESPEYHAFREAILFRSENRYLWICHISLNLPNTFRSMHPGKRKLVMPALARDTYSYFKVPNSDFDYTFQDVGGRSAILSKPFRLGRGGDDWRGIGFCTLGDVTDVIDVKLFAREADLPAAQAELQTILEGFSYGKPTR